VGGLEKTDVENGPFLLITLPRRRLIGVFGGEINWSLYATFRLGVAGVRFLWMWYRKKGGEGKKAKGLDLVG